MTPIRLSLVIPTYRRPESLVACLDAVDRQLVPVDEVLVVHRPGDEATVGILRGRPGLRTVAVHARGVLAAMASGAEAASGTLIGFVDDDVSLRPEWHQRIRAWFDDPAVGGACGRDVIARPGQVAASSLDVGVITAWGRVVGNHHLGIGSAREVEVLKGANMVFRREALALPETLRGTGAQAHFEVATSLWSRNRGWKLVFDPQILVDHAPAERFDADTRSAPERRAVDDAADNFVFCLLSERHDLLLRRTVFGLLIGDGGTVGLGRGGVAVLRGETAVRMRLGPSLRGQLRATVRVLRGGRVAMRTFPV